MLTSTDVLIVPLTLPHNVVIIRKHLDYQASLKSDSLRPKVV